MVNYYPGLRSDLIKINRHLSLLPHRQGVGMVYSVPTGTLTLDMIDLKNASQDQKLSVPWGSVMSGGLGNTANDIQLGIEAIDQAFAQSPYVQTN